MSSPFGSENSAGNIAPGPVTSAEIVAFGLTTGAAGRFWLAGCAAAAGAGAAAAWPRCPGNGGGAWAAATSGGAERDEGCEYARGSSHEGAPNTIRNCSTSQSSSARSTVSGGASLMTCSCVSFASTPRASKRSQNSRAEPAAAAISMPTSSPRPRSSTMHGARNAASLPNRYSPCAAARSASRSSTSTPSAARPTAAASGLPPNVLP